MHYVTQDKKCYNKHVWYKVITHSKQAVYFKHSNKKVERIYNRWLPLCQYSFNENAPPNNEPELLHFTIEQAQLMTFSIVDSSEWRHVNSIAILCWQTYVTTSKRLIPPTEDNGVAQSMHKCLNSTRSSTRM